MADYDTLWTPARAQKVVDAAVKYGVALEISASYKLPRLPFLKQAKAAGVKFSFGSNGRYQKMGLLDYSIAMAKELGLKPSDMFTPAPDGQKAVQRRRLGWRPKQVGRWRLQLVWRSFTPKRRLSWQRNQSNRSERG
jgi:hypothetical protein